MIIIALNCGTLPDWPRGKGFVPMQGWLHSPWQQYDRMRLWWLSYIYYHQHYRYHHHTFWCWWSYWRVTSATKYFTFRDESGLARIEIEIMDICKKVSQLLSTSNWIILATRILLPLAKIIMIIWMKMMIVMMTMLNKVTKGLNRRQLDWEGSLLQRDVLSVPWDFDTRQDPSRGQHGALRL